MSININVNSSICSVCRCRALCTGSFIDLEHALKFLLLTKCRFLYKEILRRLKTTEEKEILKMIFEGNYTMLYKLIELVENRDLIDVIEAVKKARKGRVPPPSWGQEIEINDRYMKQRFKEITARYLGGHRDGSGPWEFVLGVYSVKEFPLEFFEKTAHLWEFRDYNEEMGCHLHYRPTRVLVRNNKKEVIKKWKLAIRNGYILHALLPKLIDSHGTKNEVAFRETVYDWARVRFLVYEYSFDSDNIFYDTLCTWEGREYHHVTLNRNRKRTLTLEFRAFESYPLKAWIFIKVLDYFVKNDIELGKISNEYDYKDFVEYLYCSYSTNKKFTLKEVGIESKFFDSEKEYSLKEIAMRLISKFNFDAITKLVINYVYNVHDIYDHKTFFDFLTKTNARLYIFRR